MTTIEDFSVTFEKVTPESAEDGEADSIGFVLKGVGLREAVEALGCGIAVGADCMPVCSPRWFTAYEVDQDYITGAIESRSLHLPSRLTEASRMRIARLLGCYGA